MSSWYVGKESYTHMCGPNHSVERTATQVILYLHDGRELRDGDLHSLRACCRNKGITIEAWAQMYEDQNGLCDICEKPETQTYKGTLRNLSIDHCHTTGQVRGLLCDACNTAIGRVDDDVDLLWKCIEYLLRGSQA